MLQETSKDITMKCILCLFKWKEVEKKFTTAIKDYAIRTIHSLMLQEESMITTPDFTLIFRIKKRD